MRHLFYILSYAILTLSHVHGMNSQKWANPDLDAARRPCADDAADALVSANLAARLPTPGLQEVFVMCPYCDKEVTVYENSAMSGKVTRFLAKHPGAGGVLRIFVRAIK